MPNVYYQDTDTVNLNGTGEQPTPVTADVRLSPNTSNQISIDPLNKGLLVMPNTVVDTNTVDLELSGREISADVKISNDVRNMIEARADGLFVRESLELVYYGAAGEQTIPAGYPALTLRHYYDPYSAAQSNRYPISTTNQYYYHTFISLTRRSAGASLLTGFRMNSATIVPFPTQTGGSFHWSWHGPAPNTEAMIRVVNPTGADIDLTGIEFDRPYWNLTVFRGKKT